MQRRWNGFLSFTSNNDKVAMLIVRARLSHSLDFHCFFCQNGKHLFLLIFLFQRRRGKEKLKNSTFHMHIFPYLFSLSLTLWCLCFRLFDLPILSVYRCSMLPLQSKHRIYFIFEWDNIIFPYFFFFVDFILKFST